MALGRGFAGGFASGLQAGSQTVARAMEQERAQKEQEYLDEQRAIDRKMKSDIASAYAPAQTEEKSGLMVKGPDGKAFFIPGDARDAAATYARQGYDVAEAPTRYAETTAGGRTLGQVDTSTFVGPEPGRGMQQEWNAGRNQRAMDIALAAGRPEAAAAYGQVEGQGLQRELTKHQIRMAPGQEEQQQIQLKDLRRRDAIREGSVQLATELYKGNYKGVSDLINKTHPNEDGSKVDIVKDAKGPGFTVNFVDREGKVIGSHPVADTHALFGETISRMDPDKMLSWHESERKFLHDKQQGELAMKKLDIAIKQMGAKAGLTKEQQADMANLRTVRQSVADRLAKKEITWEQAREELNVASLKFGGQIAEPRAPARAGRDYSDADDKAHEEAVAKFIERQPNWSKMSDADRDEALAKRFPGRYGPDADGGGAPTLRLGDKASGKVTSGSSSTTTEPGGAGSRTPGRGPAPGSPAARAVEARNEIMARERAAAAQRAVVRQQEAERAAVEQAAAAEAYRKRNAGLMESQFGSVLR